jgi:ketosteroid isomerase-like protein
MMQGSSATDTVLGYIEAAQRARREQTGEAWDATGAFWDEDIEIRVADGRGGQTWRTTAQGRSDARALLSRAAVDESRLSTRTVRAIRSTEGDVVVVEQISELRGEDGSVTAVPVCHVFDVVDGRIRRVTVYRNEREVGLPAG